MSSQICGYVLVNNSEKKNEGFLKLGLDRFESFSFSLSAASQLYTEDQSGQY